MNPSPLNRLILLAALILSFAGLGYAQDLFVGSFNTNNVLRFNGATGASLGTFATGGGLTGPQGVTFGPDGNLYVTSFTTNQVIKFNGTTGAPIGVFVTAGLGGLNAPTGLTFGPDGNLYVSSAFSNQVIKYNGTTGALIGVFAAGGGLNVPTGLVFGPDGNLYVSSGNGNEVLKYNGTTGAFISTFVPQSLVSPNAPQGIVFGPDGNLYVASMNTNQVLKYNGATGAFIGVFASTGLNFPVGIAFGPDGNFYVANLFGNNVVKFNGVTGANIGVFATGLNGGTFLAFAPANNFAAKLSDQKSGSLLVFPFYGSTSTANDTRMTITNVGPAGTGLLNQAATAQNINVHLFWLDSSCSQADIYTCLTPFASISFKASEWDPVTSRGTMIAVAVDPSGYPIAYNGLVGNAFVNFTTADGNKYLDNYGAESFSARGDAVILPNNGGLFFYSSPANPVVPGTSAQIRFNNGPANNISGYDAAPVSFAAEIQSPLDAVGQTIIMASLTGTIGGTLTGAGQSGVATLYRGDEKLFSFTGINSGCNSLTLINETTPRVVGGLSKQIGTGQTGTMIWTSPAGAVGLFITPITSGAKTNAWSGIRGLHKRATAAGTLVMPVFTPAC